MKRVNLFVAVAFCLGSIVGAQAQINVQSDGGVKIGTAPRSPVSLAPPTWRLGAKGLEVAIGEILFHTDNYGELRLGDQMVVVSSKPRVDLGTVSYGVSTTLTGTRLSFGTSTAYAHSVYVNNLTTPSQPQIISDRRYKENIRDISDSRAKILQLRPVSYDLKTPVNYEGDTMGLKNKVGFIAQEVQTLFPGLVGYILETDQYTLDYTSLIPYLTQTIQVQNQQIEDQELRISAQKDEIETLESRISDMERILSGLLSREKQSKAANGRIKNETVNTKVEAKLYQNVPNPYSEETVIAYELPDQASSAKIIIYNSEGKTVRMYDLSPKAGLGQITIEASSFKSGVYMYSLVLDGRPVATKRMVVMHD